MYDDEKFNVIGIISDYKNAIIKNNGIPFMIYSLLNIDYFGSKKDDIPELTNKDKELYEEMVDMCDGIIIPGGYKTYNYYEYIVKYAIEKDIPVLGICLGMQLLSNIDNQEYSLQKNETVINHKQPYDEYVHKVNILDKTLLGNIISKHEIIVNSNHLYHVTKVNKFIVSAYSEDGIIEGIELPNKKFVLGVQWHPERLVELDNNANCLFVAFIKACYEQAKISKRRIFLKRFK